MKLASLVLLASLVSSVSITHLNAEGYSPRQYIKDRKLKNARIVPQGKLQIDGQRMFCGRRPTVLDPTFNDFGGAFDGFIILNPVLMKKLPRQVKIWIYGHECAHQFRGHDEATADCFAVQRGRRRGWLTQSGLKQICKFIWTAPATSVHPPGPERCQMMKKCFATAYSRKK